MVARLGRHAHAALLRLPDHLHGVARRQVHDVAPAMPGGISIDIWNFLEVLSQVLGQRQYRVSHLLATLGWGDLTLGSSDW